MEYFGVEIPNIRRVNINNKTYYSVVDVWQMISDSPAKKSYWYDFKKQNSWVEPLIIKADLPCRSLYQQPTDCADADGILMIICSIRSERAMMVRRQMAKAFSDKLKQTKGTSLVKFIESIE